MSRVIRANLGPVAPEKPAVVAGGPGFCNGPKSKVAFNARASGSAGSDIERGRSLRTLATPQAHGGPFRAVDAMGHKVSKSTIPKLLEMLQYRRQVNRRPWKAAAIPISTAAHA
jgi:hypothetical protein